jgi:hypothetical protein
MSLMQLLLASAAAVSSGNTVQYLVIGGGGGGSNGAAGSYEGGGGGAGGFRTDTLSITLATNHTVTVGAGGAPNTKGADSVFSSITSSGGGAGGPSGNNKNGGSGGGIWDLSPVGLGNTPSTTPSQGNNGGAGNASSASGGGGGAGAVGANGVGLVGGNGGAGSSSSITGSSVTYAGGGGAGGGGSGRNGTGGTGGGGTGSIGTVAGGNGTANTGGGGGGGSSAGNTAGGTGGSGVVILRYPNTLTMTNPGGGLTFSTAAVGGDTVATITAGTGNVQFNTGIVTSGLVMHLDAGNAASYPGSGTAWNDLSGNGNNLTATNSPTWNSNGWFATGATGYFTRATGIAMPQGNDSYTLQAWVRLSSWTALGGIMSIGGFGTTNQSNALRTGSALGGGGVGRFSHYWWANDLEADNNNASLSLNTWFMITANFDGTTRRIFANTTQVASDTPGSGHNVTSSTIQVAKTNLGGGEYLEGDMAKARIYNRAIPAAEVDINFNADRGRFDL